MVDLFYPKKVGPGWRSARSLEDTDSYSSSLIFQTPSETLRDGDTCLDANTLRVTLATLPLELSFLPHPSVVPSCLDATHDNEESSGEAVD